MDNEEEESSVLESLDEDDGKQGNSLFSLFLDSKYSFIDSSLENNFYHNIVRNASEYTPSPENPGRNGISKNITFLKPNNGKR